MTFEDVLNSLVGLEFSGSSRAVNMECFKFGELTNEGDKVFGKFALNIQCPWRITNSEEIIVASDDLFEHPENLTEYDQEFDWDKPNGNYRDLKLKDFFENNSHKVMKAELNLYGDVIITFEKEVRLTLFPSLSKKSEYSEFWRIFESRNEHSKHYVYTTMGKEFD
jgi:hypothetical protein